MRGYKIEKPKFQRTTVYVWSAKEGFSVVISQRKLFNQAEITRAGAKAFSREFKDAEKMAAFIKQQTDF